MTQPKDRRRAARRKAQQAPKVPRVYIHVCSTGQTRNPIGKVSPLERPICAGFGSAVVLRDNKIVIDAEHEHRRSLLTSDGVVTLRRIEKYIRRMRQGYRRWVAVIQGPLWGAAWERRRPGKWVCIKADNGFA